MSDNETNMPYTPANDKLTPEVPAEQHNDYAEQIAELRAEYEAKMVEQASTFQAELRKRDDVIKQILTGKGEVEKTPSVADKINSKRNYKKW